MDTLHSISLARNVYFVIYVLIDTHEQKRPLGIPNVADRTIQQAITQQLAPTFEREFSDNGYGFRPGRNTHQAASFVPII